MGKHRTHDNGSDDEQESVERKKRKTKLTSDEQETASHNLHKKHKHSSETEEPSSKRIKVEETVDLVAGETSVISVDDEVKVKQEGAPSYEELAARVVTIAKPLANEKLANRLYKAVRKASKYKALRRGVKEVTKSLRKGEKGIAVLAGDISPIDVISHVPVYCEEQSVPYVFVPSRFDLGSAALTKRPTSMVLIKQNKEYEKHFNRCMEGVTSLPHPLLSCL